MPRECGASSTLRPLGSIADVSGILDHPPSRVTTPGVWYRYEFSNNSRCSFPISRLDVPEVCQNFPYPLDQRAQGIPGARCTRGLVCNSARKKRTRAYRFSGGNPAFPAQWFYGLFRTLPGDRAFLPPSPAKVAFRELDASVGASGPHDFAVRIGRSRLQHHQRPPHPVPTSVTIAKRPSDRDGTTVDIDLIWVRREAEYFCKGDWTPGSKNCPSGKSPDGTVPSACFAGPELGRMVEAAFQFVGPVEQCPLFEPKLKSL